MHGRKTIKSITRVAFLVLQSLIFIFGIGLLFGISIVFFKEKALFGLSYSFLLLTVLICLFHVATASTGIFCLLSHKKYKVGLFIVVAICLINLQVFVLQKMPKITEEVDKTATSLWNRMSEKQKASIEVNLNCCGDGRKDCRSVSCSVVFRRIARGIRKTATKFLVTMVFVESLSVGLICVLKLRK